MYKAKNIDTDKALQAIEAYRLRKEYDYDRDLYGLKKYYAGIQAGLDFAESLFKCANYEKEKVRTEEPMNDIEKAILTIQRLSNEHIDDSYDLLTATEALREKQEAESLLEKHYGDCTVFEFVETFISCIEKETDDELKGLRILTNEDKDDYEAWKRERKRS